MRHTNRKTHIQTHRQKHRGTKRVPWLMSMACDLPSPTDPMKYGRGGTQGGRDTGKERVREERGREGERKGGIDIAISPAGRHCHKQSVRNDVAMMK